MSQPTTQKTHVSGPSKGNMIAKIRTRDARVGVIGLGYVGLPLALTFAEKRYRVLGFDVDPEKVAAIGRGEGYIKHLDPTRVTAVTRGGLLPATADFARLGEPDAILICVPTPLTPQREPDMTYVVDTARKVEAALRRGAARRPRVDDLPGHDRRAGARHPRRRRGLRAGSDFFLAFSPEREDPETATTRRRPSPRWSAAWTRPRPRWRARSTTRSSRATVAVSSARTAEAVKLTENIFRAVNIALVNELKVVYDAMGIDVWEVLDAAVDQALRLHALQPRPRLGRPLHPARPVLPVVEGARVRRGHALHRARGRGERAACPSTW